jgi:TIR domain-containing protein
LGQRSSPEWVSKFAFRLQANGLEVVVDQWHLKLGDSLPRFMENAVATSDFVLLICTPSYKGRADDRVRGVGYEQDLMTAERLIARHYSKFVPVLREGNWYKALPKWIAGHLGADLRGETYAEDNFQNLVEYLIHAPIRRR